MLSKKSNKLLSKKKDSDLLSHFKDEYVFDFLGLKDEFAEKDLKKAIITNLKQFFLEFGKHLTFVGEEHKIVIGNEDFRIDLLFFHRVLRCLIAVELKIGKFKPEFIGKMQFYLTALDNKYKLANENPSVGLILCEVIKVALNNIISPMKVAVYKTKVINTKLLKQKLHSLPFPNETVKIKK